MLSYMYLKNTWTVISFSHTCSGTVLIHRTTLFIYLFMRMAERIPVACG